jgi:hypothetical protein
MVYWSVFPASHDRSPVHTHGRSLGMALFQRYGQRYQNHFGHKNTEEF